MAPGDEETVIAPITADEVTRQTARLAKRESPATAHWSDDRALAIKNYLVKLAHSAPVQAAAVVAAYRANPARYALASGWSEQKIVEHAVIIENAQREIGQTLQTTQALPSESAFPTLEKTAKQSASGRIYLNVLFKEKEAAKRLGAKWDEDRVSWYIPPGVDRKLFTRWMGMPAEAHININNEFASDLANALHDAGLVIPGMPVMDGSWQRTSVTTSSNRKARKGVYRAVIDTVIKDGISVPVAHGYIQNFDTGYAAPWTPQGITLSVEQRAQFARQAEENRQFRDAELAAEREAVAQQLAQKWEALPIAEQHPYLTRKGVPAIGLRLDGTRLVTPVVDAKGKLWSLQYIPAEAGKRKLFAEGGQKTGNFHLLGSVDGATTVLFAEGYATAASLHLATGLPVVEVFDSGNFDAVMRALAPTLAGRTRVVCGDDDVLSRDRILEVLNQLATNPLHAQLAITAIASDELQIDGQPRRLQANPDCVMRLAWQTVVAGVPRVVGEIIHQANQHRASVLITNVGREKAQAAAAKHGGVAVFPTFEKAIAGLSDFNDLHVREGLAAVQVQVMAAITQQQAMQTPVECARAALGENAVVHFARDNQRYAGLVIANTASHSVQSVGKNTAIAHDLSKLDHIPTVGISAKIVYQSGRAQVLDSLKMPKTRQR